MKVCNFDSMSARLLADSFGTLTKHPRLAFTTVV